LRAHYGYEAVVGGITIRELQDIRPISLTRRSYEVFADMARPYCREISENGYTHKYFISCSNFLDGQKFEQIWVNREIILKCRLTLKSLSLNHWTSPHSKELPMAKKSKTAVNETDLSKGQLRKLNALRKSLGNEIADEAFAKWLREQPAPVSEPEDKNAVMIQDALGTLIEKKGLRIPKSGYLVKRGRGRVIVERPGD